ncbi:MAG: Hsp33 family molecular chaperone HslO [Hyphomonadaceae bacterium]
MQDDFVAPFSLDSAPVRGRVARMGAGALDPILKRHDYPRPVALLLGEALTMAALLGSLLKADGRLIVQAQGEGPAPLLVAEHGAGGHLRGYARLADGAATALSGANRLPPREVLGAGQMLITLDQGEGKELYQGVAALEGDTLAACAEHYFRTSEQTETRIKLAIGEVMQGDRPAYWRGGGALLQRIAADDARGDVAEDWNRASILFATLEDQEIVDPDLAADRLLYRLFHEEGVRMADAAPLSDRCTCTEDRLRAVMRSFPADEVRTLVEADGMLRARCQFCAREYVLTLDSVLA